MGLGCFHIIGKTDMGELILVFEIKSKQVNGSADELVRNPSNELNDHIFRLGMLLICNTYTIIFYNILQLLPNADNEFEVPHFKV